MKLIEYAYSADGEHLGDMDTSRYVARHEIDPTTLSTDAQRIVRGEATVMPRQEWVYLASQYIAGLPVRKNTTRISDAPSSSNTYTGTLSRQGTVTLQGGSMSSPGVMAGSHHMCRLVLIGSAG